MELGLLIDGSEGKLSAQEPQSYPVYLQSYLPLTISFFIMDACSGHISYHNPTCILTELSPLNHVFIVVACPAHILLSKKRIEMKLGL